jgi:uncharacterized glyoxalase superfamily protein PhnB
MLRGAATVFTVTDIVAAITYYRDALGFDASFTYGEPVYYACLCRDDVDLHLIAGHATKRQVGQGALCIFVEDVDAVHAELVSRGARVLKPPQTYPYGMRDFDVEDPDGNQLIYGMEAVAIA